VLNQYLNVGTYSYDWNLCDSKGVRVNGGIFVAKEASTGESIKISVVK